MVAQTETRLFLHHSYIKTENVVQREDYLYIHVKSQFFSLSAFKEQPCATTIRLHTFVCERLCVGVEGVNGCWLEGEVWFSRWHTGAPLATAHYQLRKDSYTCETHYILTKTLKVVGSLFVWQWQTAKAIWRQCYNQLLVQKGSFRQSHNYYGPTIHIFVWGHHNFHTSSVCNMIALWFKLQNGLCWTDLIIVQCSRLWRAITL